MQLLAEAQRPMVYTGGGVILSNASDQQIHRNVEKLGVPFQAVYTAEQDLPCC